MAHSAMLTLGQRIELARRRRGLSRQTLASLVGRSVEWLRQVEKNEREPDRLSVLLRLAEVLHINDVAGFLGITASTIHGSIGNNQALEQIRQAFLQYRTPLDNKTAIDGASLEIFRARVAEAWSVWRNSLHRYTNTLQLLPTLLEQISNSGCPENREVFTLAAHTYRLTSTFVQHTGDAPLALLAIERGMAAAGRSGDRLTHLACAAAFSEILLRLGFIVEAREFCFAAMGNPAYKADMPTDTSLERLSARCALLLVAAEIAARQSDHHMAELLLHRAHGVAEQLSQHPLQDTCLMNPVKVSVHAVRVQAILGRTRQALRLAGQCDVSESLDREDRAQHYLTIAWAHSRERDPVAATYALLRAEESSPEEMRFNAEAQRILHSVLQQDNAMVRRELMAIAERANIV